MARLTAATGASGLVTITLTAPETKTSTRIYGFAAAANNTAAMTAFPNVTLTNILANDGTTFTATVSAPVGGANTTLSRAIHFLYGPEYEFVIAQGQSTTIVYANGSAAGTPHLLVWYLQI